MANREDVGKLFSNRAADYDSEEDVGKLFEDESSSLPLNVFSNEAAYLSQLTENPDESYNTLLIDLQKNKNNSEVYKYLQEGVNLNYMQNIRETYQNILANDYVDIDTKEKMALDYVEKSEEDVPTDKAVMQSELNAYEPGRSIDIERNIQKLYNGMDKAFQVREAEKLFLLYAQARTDKNIGRKVADMLELFVPILDSAPIRQLDGSLQSQLREYNKDSRNHNIPRLAGERISLMRENYESLSLDEKIDFLKNFSERVGELPSTVLFGSNDLMKMKVLDAVVGGDYSRTEEAFDNVVDLMVIFGFVKGVKAISTVGRDAGKILKTSENLGEAVDRTRAVYGAGNPVSFGEVVKDMHPEKAKVLYQRALADETGDLSLRWFGKSREELFAHSNVPMPTQEGLEQIGFGSVGQHTLYGEIKHTLRGEGALHLTENEMSQAINHVGSELDNLTGFAINPEKSMIGEKGGAGNSGRVEVNAVFGLRDGSPTVSPEASRGRLARSLAMYGVEPEDISIVKVGLGDASENMFKVNFEVDPTLGGKVSLQEVDPKRTWLSRFKPLGGSKWNKSQGTVMGHFFDANSQYPKWVTQGANFGVDQGSRLAGLLKQHAEVGWSNFISLNSTERGFVEEYIKKSNHYGTPYNYTQLRAEGVSEEAISTLKSFRESQDLLWEISNLDLIKDARAQGYWLYSTKGEDQTRLLLRPRELSSFQGKGVRAYDPKSGTTVRLSSEEVEEIYKNGGSIGSSKSVHKYGEGTEEITIGGKDGVPVIARAEEGTTYRALRDDDTILNYREGYYSVRHKAPHYVDKIFKNPKTGAEERTTIGVAGSHKEAQSLLEELTARNAEENVTFRYRADIKRDKDIAAADRDISYASGLSSQRVRGAPLSTSSNLDIRNWDNPYVEHPFVAMSNSLAEVSNKTMMRDWINTMRERWNNQYGHLVDKSKFGEDVWPADASHIGLKGQYSTKEIADAREMYSYISRMEASFSSAVDDLWSQLTNGIADQIGRFSSVGEKATRALDVSPTKVVRSAGTHSYISLNPFRQFMLNAHQSVQLLGGYPKEAPFIASDLGRAIPYMLGKGSGKDAYAKELAEGFIKSGLGDSVRHHTLTSNTFFNNASDALSRLDSNVVGRTVKKVAESPKRIGMETGELINKTTAYAAAFRKMKNKVGGRALTKRELSEVAAEVQSFTYNFNKAGEMAYNSNTLGMLFHFMQVPHKAFLQMTTDRTLTVGQRARMAAFNTAMYGVPSIIGWHKWMEHIDDVDLPEWAREGLAYGFEAVALNASLTALSGQSVKMDWAGGGLSPLDPKFLVENYSTLFTADMMEMVANSPSGSLFFGSSPRIEKAVKAVAGWMYPPSVDNLDVSWKDAIHGIASISSGYSYYTRMQMAKKYGKAYSGSMNISDWDVSPMEANLMLLGVSTIDTANKYRLEDFNKKAKKEYRDEVTKLYNDYKSILSLKGDPNTLALKLNELGIINSFIKERDTVEFYSIWKGLIENDTRKNEYSLPRELDKLYYRQVIGEGTYESLKQMLPPSNRVAIEQFEKAIEEGVEESFKEPK